MEKGRVGREGANEGPTTLEGKGGDRKEERGEEEGEEICRTSVSGGFNVEGPLGHLRRGPLV